MLGSEMVKALQILIDQEGDHEIYDEVDEKLDMPIIDEDADSGEKLIVIPTK